MVKRFVLILLLALSASTLYAQTSGINQLYKLVKDTYETKADSMTHAFIESFMIKDKGYFNSKYQHYSDNAYWQQAPSIDVVICNFQRHKRINQSLANKYLNYIKLWYKNKANNYSGAPAASSTTPSTSIGYKMFENPYTDDMCWITLALLHIAEATGTSSYAIIARQVFDNYIIKRAHLTEDSTAIWLPWNTDAGSGPNACTQSPATLIAAKLYQKYGTAKYLEYAKKLYKYTANNIVESDGRIGEPPLTYTQGTFAEACRILYHVTDENTTIKNRYKSQAYKFINYTFTSDRCTNEQHANILRDEGSDGNQSIFKAVFIPYAVNFVLDESMTASNRKTIYNYILSNTKMLWTKLNFDRYPIVFYNPDWTKPYTGADSDASMGAACSGASLIENTARMCRTIVDRYELGSLLTTCNKYVASPELEEEEVFLAFNEAKQAAAEILDNPDNYMSYQFRQAIENLEAAYQALQDFATDIRQIASGQQHEENDIFDLSGRKIVKEKQVSAKANLPRGIYIIGGRKVLIK